MARFLEGRAGVGVVGIRTLEVEADAVDRHLSDVLAVGRIDDEAFGSIVAMCLLLVVVTDRVDSPRDGCTESPLGHIVSLVLL